MAVNLRNLFLGLQKKLEASLLLSREMDHPTTKGDTSELNWQGMLKKHLPSRYRVSRAKVLDCTGSTSDLIDLVIFDQHYTPLLFNEAGSVLIPSESVYAVLEVKPNLDRENLEYAMAKAESVRRLKRTSSPMVNAGKKVRARTPPRILAGFLCLGSSWKPPFGQPFRSCLRSSSENGRIDLGCVLNHGSFEAVYQGGHASVTLSRKDTTLVFFFLRLLHRLQQMGTVPAIKLNEYGRGL